ncbi:glycosyltransferase [Candidatus Poribacteria bacterium]|nr:glycosyltransferase [Candidatus Poribacteria bacterium]
MKDPLKILFVSPTIPYPPLDGGRIRVLNVISRLCRGNDLTFLAFAHPVDDKDGVDYLNNLNMEVVTVESPDSGTSDNISGLWRSFIHRKPFTVAKYYSKEMVNTLSDLLNSGDFDLVHFEMIHTGQFLFLLKRMPQCVTVLGQQNVDSGIWYRLAKNEFSFYKKSLYLYQYGQFADYENRICSGFDLCTCVSEEDKQRLINLCPDANIEVIENGVDLEYFKPFDETEERQRIVFTGSMDWQPNEDAVIHFCKDILPIIQDKFPDVEFYIVGSKPTLRVQELDKIYGVTVTGSVEDVRPYISSASVFVVPLRIGGGTRLKILQALAMNKATVSTSVGAEGLGLESGNHIMISDSPDEFAEFTVNLMKDDELRYSLANTGRDFVKERYSWDVIVYKMETEYRKIIDKHKKLDKA